MMKGNYLYIACGFVLAGMMACTNDTPGIRPMDEEASRIYLSAGVGEPAVSSRTPYQYEVPTMSQPLDVSVWASTTSGSFLNLGENGSEGTVAIHTQAHFQSGAPQLLGQAIYPKNDNTPVYFVGFHPQSDTGWILQNDNNSASFTFTGMEDVMFAPQISGAYDTAYENSPTFHFRHLLTWLRIEMIADMDEEDVENRKAVAEAWGEIVSMTISSKNQVTVNNLSEEGFNSSNVIFSGDAPDMNLYHTGTDVVFPNAGSQMIPYEKLTEVAYVLCAPVDGEDMKYSVDEGKEVKVPEYTLHVMTTKRDVHIPIDLMKIDGNAVSPFTVNTMGYQFIIQLNFKMGNVIGVSAAISLDANTDWFTHGTGSTDLKEEHFNEKTNQ